MPYSFGNAHWYIYICNISATYCQIALKNYNSMCLCVVIYPGVLYVIVTTFYKSEIIQSLKITKQKYLGEGYRLSEASVSTRKIWVYFCMLCWVINFIFSGGILRTCSVLVIGMWLAANTTKFKAVLFLQRKCTFKFHLSDFAFPGKNLARVSLFIDALMDFLRDWYILISIC